MTEGNRPSIIHDLIFLPSQSFFRRLRRFKKLIDCNRKIEDSPDRPLELQQPEDGVPLQLPRGEQIVHVARQNHLQGVYSIPHLGPNKTLSFRPLIGAMCKARRTKASLLRPALYEPSQSSVRTNGRPLEESSTVATIAKQEEEREDSAEQ